MSGVYRIYGAELSPYSVKVRSYFRYKQIPHRWIVRGLAQQEEFSKYAKLPLIPLVVTPDDEGMQDSTPIIERLEAAQPAPPIHPSDPVAAFVSALIEELGDEWGNKWMFHCRWAREVDQVSAASRIACTMMPAASEKDVAELSAQIRTRMAGRVWFVGSSAQTGPLIEASLHEALAQLESHLADRPYLFGGRPTFGDFGLWGKIYNAWTDPTVGAAIEGRHPNVLAWVHRMTWPRNEGELEPWQALEATLLPFIERQAGRRFLPWSVANARAIEEGAEDFTVEVDGQAWTQKPQKYHARSLRALKDRYAAVADKTALDAVLENAGCLGALAG
ncbi:MAG: glutathione S-transferase family protein [Myxococcales bacterium]|nr:MAG: glutathione S-transferase family protein [Myxococcales bacterium]